MSMGGENGKNEYGGENGKNGYGYRYRYRYMSYLPYTCFINTGPISASYKTRTCLFEILICCLYLNILLVTLSRMVFKNSIRRLLETVIIKY